MPDVNDPDGNERDAHLAWCRDSFTCSHEAHFPSPSAPRYEVTENASTQRRPSWWVFDNGREHRPCIAWFWIDEDAYDYAQVLNTRPLVES